MSVKKEFRCLAHGPFEAVRPLCPFGGCTTVEREFRTAPATHTGGRTRGIDRTLNNLAKSYRLSDMSNRNGSVANSIRQVQAPDRDYKRILEQKFGGTGVVTRSGGIGLWGGIPKGGTYQPGVGVTDEGPGAPAALAARGARPDNVLASTFHGTNTTVKEALPSVASLTTIQRDHENLKVPTP